MKQTSSILHPSPLGCLCYFHVHRLSVGSLSLTSQPESSTLFGGLSSGCQNNLSICCLRNTNACELPPRGADLKTTGKQWVLILHLLLRLALSYDHLCCFQGLPEIPNQTPYIGLAWYCTFTWPPCLLILLTVQPSLPQPRHGMLSEYDSGISNKDNRLSYSKLNGNTGAQGLRMRGLRQV